jgi:hypothetical protein
MGGANARRILQNSLEHGLQFAWRSGNDLEHFRCRGLLPQRLAESSRQAQEIGAAMLSERFEK